MKSFNKIFIASILLILALFVGVNLLFHSAQSQRSRPYRVEVNRLAQAVGDKGLECIDYSAATYVTCITPYDGSGEAFWNSGDSDYLVREINGQPYRFDYTVAGASSHSSMTVAVNLLLGIAAAAVIGILLFVRRKILKPFELFQEIPYELSRGNLTVPVKENKNRFLGKFLWGIDLLREKLEQQKERELSLQREKKTLLLSISHDIKTPLSAIKLYANALSKDLYYDKEKQKEIAGSINAKADEIQRFVFQIIKASSEEFLNLEVTPEEFYCSELIHKAALYYTDKLVLTKTRFIIEGYTDCLLWGDLNRSIEVLQNIMENAIKYGDGHEIHVTFAQEEDCQLVTVRNSGCLLPETELPHIFDSFWRGSNSSGRSGSGLGLYICRQLMRKMDGGIFAEIQDGYMCVTVVFRKNRP